MTLMRRICVDVSNGGVKVADPRPIENYEALCSRFRTPSLDPIISCPLRRDRRATPLVCVVQTAGPFVL